MADPISSLRTNRGAPTLFDQLSTAGQISQEDQYAVNPENQFSKGLRTGAADYILKPFDLDDLIIREFGTNRMRLDKSGGQICQYVLETADQVTNSHWNWTVRTTIPSTNGEVVLPSLGASNVIMRIKVLIHE